MRKYKWRILNIKRFFWHSFVFCRSWIDHQNCVSIKFLTSTEQRCTHHSSYPIDIFHRFEHKPLFCHHHCDLLSPRIFLFFFLCKLLGRKDLPDVFKLWFRYSFVMELDHYIKYCKASPYSSNAITITNPNSVNNFLLDRS